MQGMAKQKKTDLCKWRLGQSLGPGSHPAGKKRYYLIPIPFCLLFDHFLYLYNTF